MQKSGQPRQLAWPVPQSVLTPTRLVEFAAALKSHPTFGSPSSLQVTFSGSPLGIQLSGDPSEVAPELEGLSDQSFMSAVVKAQFPSKNNLVINVSANFAHSLLTANIQNGDEPSAAVALDELGEEFPRAGGPTDHEAEQRASRLLELTKKADAAASAAERASEDADAIESLKDKISDASTSVAELKKKTAEAADKVAGDAEQVAERLSEIGNAKAQVQADRQTVQEARESVGAIEANVRQFFDEIAENKKTLQEAVRTAKETADQSKRDTAHVVEENAKLQEEIREHLLKAVGASLFSAFEKRKGRIAVSKWVWAAIAAVAISAQVGIFFWLASQVSGLPNGEPFYLQSAFLLRATATIPVVFFIWYSISQYAREREYEELYGFKSALSYSLSPYLDLVKDLGELDPDDKTRDFVVSTVDKIFRNPLDERPVGGRQGKQTTESASDLLDRVLKIVEKTSR
ncbi:hypothetical protein MLD55_12985 [Alcanivorax sp. MM125-6]|nr:hypothetical protein [Alcanivorax sp. MM125-6]